jgi:hypothetical protein
MIFTRDHGSGTRLTVSTAIPFILTYLSLYTTFHGLIHTCRYILPRWIDCGRRRGVGERGIPEHTAAGLSDGFVQTITQPRLRRRLLMEREDFGSLCPCPCPSHPRRETT